MLTTIVYAHPYDKSFNRAILDTVTASLSARGREYSLIDLCRDGFDPVLTCDELAVYPEGGMPDPLVKRYNRILDQTEKVILIFPIWWYDCPANTTTKPTTPTHQTGRRTSVLCHRATAAARNAATKPIP